MSQLTTEFISTPTVRTTKRVAISSTDSFEEAPTLDPFFIYIFFICWLKATGRAYADRTMNIYNDAKKTTPEGIDISPKRKELYEIARLSAEGGPVSGIDGMDSQP